VVLTRRWALFLIAVGVWSWVIWPRFAVAIWQDPRAWHGGTPTSFLWVHAVLIVASLVLGTVVGGLGLRALRALRAPQSSGR
jgi:intracellular septation protein A